MKDQKGFSLLEIMISMALGLILLGGVFDILAVMTQIDHDVKGLANMKQNGEFASRFLEREIADAGYLGCLSLHQRANLGEHDIPLTIQGYAYGHLPSNIPKITATLVPDSDIFILHFMNPQSQRLATDADAFEQILTLFSAPDFKVGETVFVADCLHADRVRVSALEGVHVTVTLPHHTYQRGAELSEDKEIWFYVANTTRLDARGQPVTALYRHDPQGQDEELVADITRMHVAYGLASKTGELYFVSASAVHDWQAVRAVRIRLLLASGEFMRTRIIPVHFDAHEIMPPDQQAYHEWEIVIGLANQL